MSRIFAFLAIALAGSGCSKSPWDGTWLFMYDQNSATSAGDCADDTQDDTTTVFGTDNSWIDVYATGDGRVVIDIEGNDLIGSEQGGTLVATYVEGYQDEDSLQRTTYTMNATRDGDTMAGTIVVLDEEQSPESYYQDAQSYSCTYTGSFNAVHIVSGPDDFAGSSSL
jgi:hypothetical protein